MGKKVKTGKDRRDKYYQLAKEQGFRARSAFKLVQLNRKYDFLSNSRVLIDLCAAPGGWCQVAAKYMPVSSVVIGVDLVPIKPIRNVQTLVEDITTDKCYHALKKTLKGQEVDVVLNDGAPNVGTAWVQDAYTQSELVLYSCKLAAHFLRRGGCFITKIFRSKDYNSLLWVFNQLFKHVHATKPVASRMESAEIYVVCQQYLAPATIDPKIFDPKSVFQDLDVPVSSQTGDVFAQLRSKQKRHREGYEGDLPIHLHTTLDASEFVRKPDAPVVLAQYSAITFTSDESKLFLQQLHTSPEVRAMCQDLKVLNRKDFKLLLRWRMQMQKVIELQNADEDEDAKEEGGGGGGGRGGAGSDSDSDSAAEEESVARELADMDARKKTEAKKAKRKALKAAAKFKQRVALQMEAPGLEAEGDTAEDTMLFRLPRTEREKQAADFDDVPLAERDDIDLDDDEWMEEEDEEEDLDYEQVIERQLDRMYEQYKSTKKDAPVNEDLFVTPDRPDPLFVPDLARNFDEEVAEAEAEDDGDGSASGSESESGSEGDSDADSDEPARKKSKKQSRAAATASAPALGQAMRAGAGAGDPPSKRAALWFASEEFDGSELESEAEAEKGKERASLSTHPERPKRSRSGYVELPEGWDIRREAHAHPKGVAPAAGEAVEDEDAEIEIVPQDDGSSSDSDSDAGEGEGEGGKGRGADGVGVDETELMQRSQQAREKRTVSLALGRYLTDKKATNRLIDESYNRYVHDDDDLPSWFLEEERPHRRPQLPVTKQMVEEARQRMMTINARPIAKVAEAKGRARMKAMRRQKRLEKKASDLSQNADLSAGDKAREMERLVKAANKGGGGKGTAQKRKQKVLVRTRGFKSGKGRVAYGTKPVDARMLKDKMLKRGKEMKGKGRKRRR